VVPLRLAANQGQAKVAFLRATAGALLTGVLFSPDVSGIPLTSIGAMLALVVKNKVAMRVFLAQIAMPITFFPSMPKYLAAANRWASFEYMTPNCDSAAVAK
jgi:hypothetical protein